VACVARSVTRGPPGKACGVRLSLAVLVVACAALAGCGGEAEAPLSAGDVVVERCERLVDHPAGLPFAVGTAVNRGGAVADLRFRVLFQGEEGTRLTSGFVSLPDVPAGGTARWQSWGVAPGVPAGCDIAPR
jgi:hypothetical protein